MTLACYACPVKSSELGYQLFEDYNQLFEKYSWRNRLYANATFHLLFGQLPNIRRMRIIKSSGTYLDPRVHVCYLSPSGSGKGPGAELVSRLSSRLGLKYQVADKFTDNALIGTVQQDKRTGETWVEPGWLHHDAKLNFLAITEATMTLTSNPSQYAQEVMNIFQKSMNPMGSSDATIVKKIGFGELVEVKPRLSLFLTTYIPNNLKEVVISRGFLQRMYFIVHSLNLEQRMASSKEKFKRMRNPPKTIALEKSITDRLSYLDEYYEGTKSLRFTNESLQLLEKTSTDLYEQIRPTPPFIQDKLLEFVTRFEDLQSKLALQFALLKKHKRVEEEDAYHAKVETQYVFEDLVSFLERTISVPKEFRDKWTEARQRVLSSLEALLQEGRYHKSNGWVLQDDLLGAIRRLHSVTKLSAQADLIEMEGAGVVISRVGRKSNKRYIAEGDKEA